MKKTSTNLAYLSLCLAILTLNSFSAVLEASPSDINSGIDQFVQKVLNTADDCWRKPASNRRNAIVNKLTALQELVWEENFAEAYDKLLYDIKPKLTGLKTDEKEESWGSGVFEEAWVTCSELREEFRMECNEFLSYLKAGSIVDDDSTPPTISISYEGGYSQEDPGSWDVVVEDLESGIDEVQILIDEVVHIHHQDLGGVVTLLYQNIPVYVGPEPVVPVGTHSIEVIAVNNDRDWEGDQESNSDMNWVDIIQAPDDDTEPPVITITHEGPATTEDPGVWNVDISDAGSGLAEVKISIDGHVIIHEQQLGGVPSIFYSIPVSVIEGVHTIEVYAKDNDNDVAGDQLEITVTDEITIVPPLPILG